MMGNSTTPIAFLSYVRSLEFEDSGWIAKFGKQLSGEFQVQTGDVLNVFQDRQRVKWGRNWERRIDASVDSTVFLIPIITESFFTSDVCRRDLKQFLEREHALGRNDLILPVYYVRSATLDNVDLRSVDPLSRDIYSHRWVDWRPLRFQPFTSPDVRETIAKLALQISEALQRPAAGVGHPPESAGRSVLETQIEARDGTTSGGSEFSAVVRKAREELRKADQKQAVIEELPVAGKARKADNKVFISMAASKDMEPIYKAVSNVVGSFELVPLDMEKVKNEKVSTKKREKRIRSSRLLIEEVTHKSSTADSDIGLALSLGKTVIPIAQQGTEFELGSPDLHVIYYADAEALQQELYERIYEELNRSPSQQQ